jgi:hypothetical protein
MPTEIEKKTHKGVLTFNQMTDVNKITIVLQIQMTIKTNKDYKKC